VRVALPDASSNDAIALGAIDGVRRSSGQNGQLCPHPTGSDPAEGDRRLVFDADSRRGLPEGRAGDERTRHRRRIARKHKHRFGGQRHRQRPDSAEEWWPYLGAGQDVSSSMFFVESGTVTFVGDDSSNPQIVLKAGWTAKGHGSPTCFEAIRFPPSSGACGATCDRGFWSSTRLVNCSEDARWSSSRSTRSEGRGWGFC
jgi:hypothetical protein